MKHLRTSFTALLIASASFTSAMAGSQLYVGVSAFGTFSDDQDFDLNGTTVSQIDFDTGFGFGGNIGYDFGDFRSEVELLSFNNDISISTNTQVLDSDINSLAFMANVYYDVPTGTKLSPYIGLGAGMVDVDSIDTVFAYQGMVGVSYAINNVHEVYGGYRYFGADTVEDNVTSGKVEFDYGLHNIELGYRMRF